MLRQGGAPQLQSACRIAAGTNSPGIGLPGKQVCCYDLLRPNRQATGRSAANRRGYQRGWRLPKSPTDRRTDGGGIGRRKVAIHRWVSARWDALPPPGPPLTVGLDGGFIHAKDQKSRGEGWFEVIAGKSMPEEGAAKCFAYVQTYDTKPNTTSPSRVTTKSNAPFPPVDTYLGGSPPASSCARPRPQ
jgi:hypothetical protein